MPKIPKALSLERKRRVWELRQQFWTYERIAQEVGISAMGVHKILTRITKAYTERHIEDVDRIKAEQVAELEEVAFEAFDAWKRSKEAAKMVRKKSAVSDGQQLGVAEQTLESRDQDGDPRYLTVAMSAKEHIRKIIGADAPVKSVVAHTELDNLTDDELIQKAEQAINEARARSAKENNSATSE